MRVEGIDFEAAKLRVAEILGRHDLIETKGGQRMDAASLLQPPADQRDETLGRSYLAYRLGVPPETRCRCPRPPWSAGASCPTTTRRRRRRRSPAWSAATLAWCSRRVAPDGRRHAHRIYVAPAGPGKAELGAGPDGRPRDPKKSARLKEGQSAAGCAVLWGDPATAHHLLVAEGIETAAALALAHRAEIEAGDVAVAAALSTSGIRTFVPWPATRTITIAADRDEARPHDDRGYRAGERAARAFALAHHERLEVRIALPGQPGEDIDWLDVLRSAGPRPYGPAIAAAQPFEPAADEGKARDTDACSATSGDERSCPERSGRSRRSRPERPVRTRRAARARRSPQE